MTIKLSNAIKAVNRSAIYGTAATLMLMSATAAQVSAQEVIDEVLVTGIRGDF